MSDGLLEVVAIDNLDLAILHAGGSGASVCQCRRALITTRKPVPMQVRLLSSVEQAHHLNSPIIAILDIYTYKFSAHKEVGTYVLSIHM